MVEKLIKFLEKSQNKDLYLQILRDIYDNNLDQYDIKPLKGKSGFFRLRVGKIRFIYRKTSEGNRIVDINSRGDVYKGI